MTVEEIDEAMLFEAWLRQEHKPGRTQDQLRRHWNAYRRNHSPTDWQIPDPHKCGFWPYRPDYWDEKYGKD